MSKKFTHATNSIGYRVIKKEETSDDYDSSDEYSSEEYSSDGGGKYKYTSILESNYKKSKYGSKQDNFTKEQIREKLKGKHTKPRTEETKRKISEKLSGTIRGPMTETQK